MMILIVLGVILWTTARDEGSRALAAWIEGTEILEMDLVPGIHPEAGVYIGYVIYAGDTSWLARAAHYLANLGVRLVVVVLD